MLDIFIKERFFSGEPTHEEYNNFLREYCNPMGIQWMIQKSKSISEAVIRNAIENGTLYAFENLQIVINDVMTMDNTPVILENGIPSPDVWHWLETAINFIGEDAFLKRYQSV